jgi:hypothetical protein
MPGLAPQHDIAVDAAGVGRLFVPHGLTQRVIRARGIVGGVEVIARPRLHHRVDVGHAQLAAEADQVERGDIDAQVDAKSATRLQQATKNVAVILGRQRGIDEIQPVLAQEVVLARVRFDDHQLVGIVVEMPFDQGPCPLSDRAEADDHDRAVDAAVDGIGWGHGTLRDMVA